MTDVKELVDALKQQSSQAQKLVTDAYEFAQHIHGEQKRYSGEPYFNHVFETARSLAEVGMGPRTVAAGLLHDVIEDGGVSENELQEKFGEEVLFLVQGVTKLGTVRYRGMQRHTESLRKLFVAMSQDVRVVIIKLMDRLHNMKTLEHVPEHKQKRIALETLEIYAPIADRLGMGRLKRDLEDLAFPYADPEAYERISKVLKQKSKETQQHLTKVHKSLKKELATAGFRNFRTDYRIKGLYSLYKKLDRKGGDIEKIHDVSALRIIVPSVADCYTVLGIIHNSWRPLPGKIKDYIAFPKPNGYQSIHTTVFTGDGGTVEIQIRTEAMHREAQYGIASHFAYKQAQEGQKEETASNFHWFKQLLSLSRKSHQQEQTFEEALEGEELRTTPEWIRELAEAQHGEHESAETPREFLNSLKSDFFSHRVFVFTPEGDVVDLPLHSTPIDFAYAIHSDIGNHTVGAKVNGKLVSLSDELKNGDIVEIQTKASAHPTKKWLEFAKTALARKHIRNNLSKQGELLPNRGGGKQKGKQQKQESE